MTISVLDYQAGNIASVSRAITRIGEDCKVITTAEEVLKANKIILPGVGHFGKAMEYLHSQGLVEALHEKVIVQHTPILGICLGMQLMCKYSEEGNVTGLSWFDAHVTKMKVKDTLRYKVPHTGWNTVQAIPNHPLLKNIDQNSEFYFVHSYHVLTAPENQILTKTVFETPFISGLQVGNIFGVQFHPEKSHEAGSQLISNFIHL
ncbi:MAG: imidazole glycerol phosphate synthase subunit HisH [Fluviicola sp.]|nr:MAG: imidazole glycerol phosphate synthase subunit HisH [Fluviicola sp.]